MKTILFFIICQSFITMLQAQVSKTVAVTAGSLMTTLTLEELQTVTDLTITGTLDARDFKILRDSMPALEALEISEVDIMSYSGYDGTFYLSEIPDLNLYTQYPDDEIPQMSFTGKDKLKSIVLPLSCKSIGTVAFSDCTGLSGELHLPSSISYMGVSAFYNCVGLTGDLIIPPLVTKIEANLFFNCKGFTSLTIPPSVRQIEYNAFNGCSGLQSIEVQPFNPVPLTLESQAFEHVDKKNCTLMVPYGTRELYAAAAVWEEFASIIEHEQGFLLSTSSLQFEEDGGNDSSIGIKANVNWSASSDQQWLTVSPVSGNSDQTISITVEANSTIAERKGIITFNSEGFHSQFIHVTQFGIPKTISITPGSLTEALTAEEKGLLFSLVLTGTMDARDFKTIHDQMPLLKVLDISGATIEAFTDTTHGNQILHPANAIPAAIYEWNDSPQTSYALSEHDNLAVVKLPVSMTTIGYRAFHGCSGLTAVDLQSSVTYIGNEAFQACYALDSITLPPSVTYLGEKAFYYCSNLASIELSPSLTAINYLTFAECISLRSIDIPEAVTSISENVFSGCIELQSVVIPPLVTLIAYETFSDCRSLASVTIPPSVTAIASFAFFECSNLRTLIIPPSVNQIGASAFNGCRNLEIIYCYRVGPVDISNSDAVFADVDKTRCVLYVPAGSKELYSAANQWKNFDIIVEMTQLEVSKTEVTLEALQGSSASITISSNVLWTIGWDQPWLTIDPVTGTGNQTITFTAEANPADSVRIALVTVSAPGIDLKTIKIHQKASATGAPEMAQNRPSFTCYPNPFTQEVTIEIQNPKREKITVEIYNIEGQKVKQLADGNTSEQVSLKWDGTNDQGGKLPMGTYLCRMNQQTRQLIYGGQKGSN